MDLATTPIDPEVLRKTIHAWARARLEPYLKRASEFAGSWKPKEINDPVWGTIALEASEVALVDSPIFQRLRRVRQLGVVHWVYPGGVHTRFEHALGVLHVTQRMMDAANRAASAAGLDGGPVISQSLQTILRFSALMHDAGHMAFSHVSEKAISSRPDVGMMLKRLRSEYRIEGGHLSEFISAMIVESPSFIEFLQMLRDQGLLNVTTPIGDKAADQAAAIRKCILGQRLNDGIPTLQEFITGPFDADKIDYLARDSHYTGVPIGLDVSRLIQKIAVAKVETRLLPERFKKALPDQRQTTIIGLKASGRNSIDEIQIARALLFSKIYRHHKVMAIEAMLNASVQRLFEVLSFEQLIRCFLELGDEEYLQVAASKADVARSLLQAATGATRAELSKAEVAANLLRWQKLVCAVRDRELFVRAFVIRPNYGGRLLDANGGTESDPVAEAHRSFFSDLLDHDSLLEAKAGITNHASRYAMSPRGELRTKLPEKDATAAALDSDWRDAIWVVSPQEQGGSSIIGRAFVIHDDGSVTHLDSYPTINASHWSQAYNLDASSGYVFTARSLVNAAHYAVHAYVGEKYGVMFPPIVFELARIDRASAADVARAARAAGSMSPIVPFARPKQDCADTISGKERVDSIVRRLEALQLVDVRTLDVPPFYKRAGLRERITTWLSWFKEPSSANCALTCLEKLRILERGDYTNALTRFMEQNPEFDGAFVACLGEAKDSSSIAGYYTSDLIGSGVSRVFAGRDWEREDEKKPLIFFDDFVSTGTQASEIVGAWGGAAPSLLGEQRLPLEDPTMAKLRGRKVAFVFVTGWNTGVEKLSETTKQMGVPAKVFRHLGEGEIPNAAEVLAREGFSQDQMTHFFEECRQIAREVLPSVVEKRDKIPERLLGYGNQGLLLAFPYNVPSQTLSALWMVGRTAEHAFVGPIPRRKKA